VYNNIDSERVRLKMSVQELCEKLEISRRTYYSWQKTGKIPATKLLVMGDLFECTIDYLLGRTDNRKTA
jgi:excisionase family DNA binding protein